MSRIIGGRSRGRRLRGPSGSVTRPTAARVRQCLFDVLAARLPGCRFLDAFAGSGAVGLEALSRGASRVVLIEQDPGALRALRENARSCAAAGGQVHVYQQDARVALAALAQRGERYDVIYLDPPYQTGLYETIIGAPEADRLLADGGLLVAEHFHKRPLPERIGSFCRVRQIKIGDQRLSFYERGAP